MFWEMSDTATDISQLSWEKSVKSKFSALSVIRQKPTSPEKNWEMSSKITDISQKSWEKSVKNNFSALSVIDKIMTSPNLL
jgi:hypothetical protein